MTAIVYLFIHFSLVDLLFFDKNQVMPDAGIFYSLMEKVGDNGPYQNLSLVFWSLLYLLVGATSFYNPYLFSTGNYICSNEGYGPKECDEYVCSLPLDQRNSFLDAEFSSLATDFGYNSCSSSSDLEKIQAIIYLGGLLSLLFSSVFSDLLSKKRLLLATLITSLIGLAITILSSSILVAGIGLFLNFAVKSMQAQLVTCFITECSAEIRRGRDVMITYLFYGVGVTLNGAVFYLFDSWKTALIIYQILPFIICLLGAIFFIR